MGLLSYGSAAKPSPELLPGDEGTKQLSVAREVGEKGLSVFFEGKKGVVEQVLGEGGLPPMPVQTRSSAGGKATGAQGYEVAGEQSYNDQYPCRNFI